MLKPKQNVRRVAFGGVISALSLTIMLLSGIFPFAEYTCPALAGIILVALVIDFGKRTALIAYAAVALLSAIAVPNKESAMMFVFLFGYYPILKALVEKLKFRTAEWAVKLLIFNLMTVAAYFVLTNLLGLTQLLNEAQIGGIDPKYGVLLLLGIGNVVFIFYDMVLSRLIMMYCRAIRPKLQRIIK